MLRFREGVERREERFDDFRSVGVFKFADGFQRRVDDLLVVAFDQLDDFRGGFGAAANQRAVSPGFADEVREPGGRRGVVKRGGADEIAGLFAGFRGVENRVAEAAQEERIGAAKVFFRFANEETGGFVGRDGAERGDDRFLNGDVVFFGVKFRQQRDRLRFAANADRVDNADEASAVEFSGGFGQRGVGGVERERFERETGVEALFFVREERDEFRNRRFGTDDGQAFNGDVDAVNVGGFRTGAVDRLKQERFVGGRLERRDVLRERRGRDDGGQQRARQERERVFFHMSFSNGERKSGRTNARTRAQTSANERFREPAATRRERSGRRLFGFRVLGFFSLLI